MTPEELLARLIDAATLADVSLAFSGVNPENVEYSWTAKARLKGEEIVVEGEVKHLDSIVGRFIRRLRYLKGGRRAYHEIIEIEDRHRERRNALYHYSKAFAFYGLHGYSSVHLDADGDGPAVWPQFGFDLAKYRHKEMLHKMMRERGLAMPPSPTELFAPDVATIELEGALVGQEALRQLRERAGLPLPMILDLSDDRALRFLGLSGILDEKEPK